MLEVPAFVVIGGGADGDGYVRQLLRAVGAGRLHTRRIVVVDRDATCTASRRQDPRLQLEVAEWSTWLDDHLDACGADDHLVPYHWAPHLLVDWLGQQVARRGGHVRRTTPPAPRGLPFEGDTRAGDRALSYAAWTCPAFCIEPALCPHTRGPRDWSLAGDLEQQPGPAVAGSVVFRCTHLVWGVGTIPVREIRAARDRVVAGLASGPREWLVATSSHCHALAATLRVAPGPAAGPPV